MNTNDGTKQVGESTERPSAPDARRPYEAPQVTRKRSVQRATLFSGGGVSATGLTSGG